MYVCMYARMYALRRRILVVVLGLALICLKTARPSHPIRLHAGCDAHRLVGFGASRRGPRALHCNCCRNPPSDRTHARPMYRRVGPSFGMMLGRRLRKCRGWFRHFVAAAACSRPIGRGTAAASRLVVALWLAVLVQILVYDVMLLMSCVKPYVRVCMYVCMYIRCMHVCVDLHATACRRP